jgi:hypothetical protein
MLEALPPMDDDTVSYEKRIGVLRSLAEQNPNDFFIQRCYQDSFRKQFALGDEFDRALALYQEEDDWGGVPCGRR